MKRIMDIVGSVILLAFCLAPLTLLMLLIRITSHGDSLFVQTRIGRNGKPFKMYKLRTMNTGADELLSDMTVPMFKMKNDPRVTPAGRWLRKLCLDELPQLINVLRGDMSLVGPRPQVADEVALYRPLHHARLSVRPGMTGLWQVGGRSDLSFEEAVVLDIHYAFNHNLFMDFKILAKTLFVLTKGAY